MIFYIPHHGNNCQMILKKSFFLGFIKEGINLELDQYRDISKNVTKWLVNYKNKLLGTITDGDIRRAIIKGAKFSSALENYYFKKPCFIKDKLTLNDGSRFSFESPIGSELPEMGFEKIESNDFCRELWRATI